MDQKPILRRYYHPRKRVYSEEALAQYALSGGMPDYIYGDVREAEMGSAHFRNYEHQKDSDNQGWEEAQLGVVQKKFNKLNIRPELTEPSPLNSPLKFDYPSHIPPQFSPLIGTHLSGAEIDTLHNSTAPLMKNPCYPHVKNTVNILHASAKVQKELKLNTWTIVTPFGDQDAGQEKKLIEYAAENANHGFKPTPVTNYMALCEGCGMYINPYCEIVQNNTRWKCASCKEINEIELCKRIDFELGKIPGLHSQVVDYILPLNDPQKQIEPYLIFVLDFTRASISNGVVSAVGFGLESCLDDLPSNYRVGFIGVDTSIHCFHFQSSSHLPNELVSAPLHHLNEDSADFSPFLPLPLESLTVPLSTHKQIIKTWLSKFDSIYNEERVLNNRSMHLETQFGMSSCLGDVLGCLKDGIESLFDHHKTNSLAEVTGRIIIFQCSKPGIGQGSYPIRGGTSLLGTDHEYELLQPQNDFFRNLASEFVMSNFGIDIFAFGSELMDLSTLSDLCHLTGGDLYFYPEFRNPPSLNQLNNGELNRFFREFQYTLITPLAFASSFMIYSNSENIKFGSFLSKGLQSSMTMIKFGILKPHQSIAIEFFTSGVSSRKSIIVQASSQYIDFNGQYKLRTITVKLPITQSIPEVISSIDITAYTTIIGKRVASQIKNQSLNKLKSMVLNELLDIVTATDIHFNRSQGVGPNLSISNHIFSLPLALFSLIKSPLMRNDGTIDADQRIETYGIIISSSAEGVIRYLLPKFITFHQDPPHSASNLLNLSSVNISRTSLSIIYNQRYFIGWLGRETSNDLIQAWFSKSNVDEVSQLPLCVDNLNDSPLTYIYNQFLLTNRLCFFPPINIIKEHQVSGREKFLNWMIEDRHSFEESYQVFLLKIKEKLLPD
ncbi:hypothetical protein CONCODRAFT_15050 [Conidiobolus coronatus NRRL 28638]|uniref:Sec23/Sec24 trunk domain-containing protein n=1 Tax=Conidiobolus coronatus (strain ATCC 28846 / CBS 209.66 / NRRL 28638) TaxID=796925 RepID=A0A137PGR5_CONC2|nr:hypothetical protein CONCODRAFT_15050 [Conidiobolus coronatus NRRL 28638]|eukprot:KXN74178.1 hypothetical protein CONCODRAFT_15050 [Conidiobolus coronatus NRRL 28638]